MSNSQHAISTASFAKSKQHQVGVLVMNLGTPKTPDTAGVKAFLKDFLSDGRVVDVNPWLWQPLLRGVILPTRSPKVAKLYQSIWLESGSPLQVYSDAITQGLSERLDVPCALAMTYGEPTVNQALDQLLAAGCERIVVLPLYPQYSSTTTAAAFDALAEGLKQRFFVPHLHFIERYFDHDAYVQALAQSVREHWQQHGQGEYLLCSYHGIPVRYAESGDPYGEQCEQTTQLLGQALGLKPEQIGMSYQSKFGRDPWLEPATDDRLAQLAQSGVGHVDVITPAFSCDCLETLEEINIQSRECFLEAGGHGFGFIPCLNAEKQHIDALAQIVNDCL
ncbi:Ferrochelatase [Vibrio stylophorae]|uniref:Ferrochelatase n=1 Tax=Vibrio stylophorae TaxID=659351 RepID=A0ABM8ZRL0_9VIBR|nr:ferrochelatase [Vibrio stylophorae]CAH0532939.1 Ferrochelatase [Vibrio stylophorae]